jgi:hypothetical protein
VHPERADQIHIHWYDVGYEVYTFGPGDRCFRCHGAGNLYEEGTYPFDASDLYSEDPYDYDDYDYYDDRDWYDDED